MNTYEITCTCTLGDRTERIKVKCNNVPCAVQKAVVLLAQKTGVGGWKYKSHRLVSKGWDLAGAMSSAEQNRCAAIELARHCRP